MWKICQLNSYAKQGEASILPFLGIIAAVEALGHGPARGSPSLPAVKDLLPPGTSLLAPKMAHSLAD